MSYTPLVVCLLCLIVGIVLLRWSHVLRRGTRLPVGRIVYADTGDWEECQRPFYSSRYRLTGRPDYLVRQHRKLIPVEVKSSTGLRQPYESHVLQLVAYCLLIGENEKEPPLYGLLHYPDVTFRVPYTEQSRRKLLDTLARLRADLCSDDVARDHSEPGRCWHCGFRGVCSSKL